LSETSSAPRPKASPRLILLTLAGLTAAGLALRVVVGHQSLFADELATRWVVSGRSLGGVVSTVHSDAEITPPLYFVAAWLTTQIHNSAELLRAPSIVAGTATVPLVYAFGARTVDRSVGLLAAAFTVMGPFMLTYSTEARGYALMMALVVASTLALLRAVESPRLGWWIAYAAFSCAAFYTHYTCVFGLAVQFGWLLWAHPRLWRPALLANLGAAAAVLPWLTGLVNDFTSPTTKILSALSPFGPHAIWVTLTHWTIGYPYGIVSLKEEPGYLAIGLLALAVAIAIAGLAAKQTRPWRWSPRSNPGLVLVVALALAAPVGEAAVSLVSTHLFSVRNLAVSWPAAAVAVATLFLSPQLRPVRLAASGLALAALCISTVRFLSPDRARPDFAGVADFIQQRAGPSDVVIDAAAFSPGPLTGLDVTLGGSIPVYRVGESAETDHPFTIFDQVKPAAEVARQAAAATPRDGHIFVVTFQTSPLSLKGEPSAAELRGGVVDSLPRQFHEIQAGSYRGIIPMDVFEFARSRA
jgi:4-amino-4-deoxy-L-arabinose transferase-like glycosyltransferase